MFTTGTTQRHFFLAKSDGSPPINPLALVLLTPQVASYDLYRSTESVSVCPHLLGEVFLCLSLIIILVESFSSPK